MTLDRSAQLTWTAFLAANILIVGLVGLFATYAAPITFQRELRIEALLDKLGSIPQAQWPALRDQLGDSAKIILDQKGAPGPRVAAARDAMSQQFAAEAQAELEQLRLLIVVVTAMATLFGAILMRLASR